MEKLPSVINSLNSNDEKIEKFCDEFHSDAEAEIFQTEDQRNIPDEPRELMESEENFQTISNKDLACSSQNIVSQSSSFDIPEISREDQRQMIDATADITEELQVDTIMTCLTTWDLLVGPAMYITLRLFLKMIDPTFEDKFALAPHFNR